MIRPELANCALSAQLGPTLAIVRWGRVFVLPGLLTCMAIAALAGAAGTLAPIVGAPVIGIVAGVVLRLAFGMPSPLVPGVDVAGASCCSAR